MRRRTSAAKTEARTWPATSSRNCTIGNHLLTEELPRGKSKLSGIVWQSGSLLRSGFFLAGWELCYTSHLPGSAASLSRRENLKAHLRKLSLARAPLSRIVRPLQGCKSLPHVRRSAPQFQTGGGSSSSPVSMSNPILAAFNPCSIPARPPSSALRSNLPCPA